MLIGARFIQGVGGAMASAVILGMIVTMFPEPREQAKAIGVFRFVASAGGSIGLLAGGVLTEAINWHWIFFINLPVGIATALLAVRLVEDRPGIGFGEGADLPGAALLTAGLMLGVYTILGVGEEGWGSTQTLVLGAVSIALVAAFVARQARIANPLMPLRLFRSRNVAGREHRSGAARRRHVRDVLPRRALHAADPRLRRARGRPRVPAVDASSWAAMSLRVSDRLSMRFGAASGADPGLGSHRRRAAAVRAHAGRRRLLRRHAAAMLLIGAGAGLGFPALMTLAMSGATWSDSGLASGLVNTSVQVGGAIGLAVLATFASERTDGWRPTASRWRRRSTPASTSPT